MEYYKTYESLISSRKVIDRDDSIYLETHHIIPISMGGTNDEENLVKLTLREHLLAHWLLWKSNKTVSLGYALSFISKRAISLSKLMGESGEKIRTSRVHQEAKEAHTFANKNKKNGTFHNTDLRKKQKLTEERKQQISKFFAGRPLTDSQKTKIGAANSISLRGRTMSEEEKIKRDHRSKTLGQKRSTETRRRIQMSKKIALDTTARIEYINEKNIDFVDSSWLTILSNDWHISTSGVRYWVKRYFPEKYYLQ